MSNSIRNRNHVHDLFMLGHIYGREPKTRPLPASPPWSTPVRPLHFPPNGRRLAATAVQAGRVQMEFGEGDRVKVTGKQSTGCSSAHFTLHHLPDRAHTANPPLAQHRALHRADALQGGHMGGRGAR